MTDDTRDLGNPLNPLTKYNTYQVKHVVVGFRYSEDACKFNITGNIGVCGTIVGKNPEDKESQQTTEFCGPGIVVINELEDPTFVLYEAETFWKFFNEKDSTTGSYSGYIHIQDRIGMLFAHKLREYCDRLGVALGHITFSWKTFFIGTNSDGEDEVISINPMVFHVTDFAQSLSAEIGRSYIMNIVSSYNTFGQLPQFSKMFQTTLTHADGNVQKEIPVAESSDAGLLTRQEEDRNKNEMRKRRLDKSKPMKTIRDVFDSLQTEMTEQALPSKNQVQEWQSVINDGYTKKLIPPEQYVQELPMRYSITLDSEYDSIKVDNRNLPFEQPEQDQRLEGIRTIPFHLGTSLTQAIQTTMMLSRAVGKKFSESPPKGFRITSTVLRECDGRYNIHTNVNQYVIPRNEVDGVDTAPGDHVINGPIELFYQDQKPGYGRDIISISYHSNVTPTQTTLEKEVEDSDDIGVVYGNREPVTIQRQPIEGDDFFTSGYAGNRAITNVFDTSGVENSDTATVIKTNLNAAYVKQSTSYRIKIPGNPNLLNDLNRNPLDVRANVGNTDGGRWQYLLYDKVEHQPMYIKLSVFLRTDAYLSGIGSSDASDTYFYSGFLHVTSIHNRYTNNTFIQNIEGVRTEDSI